MKAFEDEIIRILQSHKHQTDDSKAVNRTGHARFRRGPAVSEPVKAAELKSNAKVEMKVKSFEECKGINSANSSGSSSITGEAAGEEGTVSNGKAVIGAVVAGIAPAPRTYSSGKPPLPTSHRKRCREIEVMQKLTSKSSGSRGCHCCKRRKTVVKREIKKVTTSGSAGDCIPADEYSWKKYDQKLIPGTSFPRGYYKCNSGKGCPARKRVERASNDPTVLILTYEGEHRHHHHHHHHRSQSSSHHHPTVAALTRLKNSSDVGTCY